MKCVYCGAELSANARFCRHCGKPVIWQQENNQGANPNGNQVNNQGNNQGNSQGNNQGSNQGNNQGIGQGNNQGSNQSNGQGIGQGNQVNNQGNNVINNQTNQGNVPPVVQPKKSGKGCLIAILIAVAIVVLIGVGIAGFVVYSITSAVDSSSYNNNSVYSNSYETEDIQVDTEEEEREKEHSYTVVKEDVSWYEAKNKADYYSHTSYLVTINSVDEFDLVTQLAYDEGIKVLWVGINRDYDVAWEDSYWENGERFNALGRWYPGEPTYFDEEGNEERYLMLFYVNGVWYFNDSIEDVSSIYPEKIGYIIEGEY